MSNKEHAGAITKRFLYDYHGITFNWTVLHESAIQSMPVCESAVCYHKSAREHRSAVLKRGASFYKSSVHKYIISQKVHFTKVTWFYKSKVTWLIIFLIN